MVKWNWQKSRIIFLRENQHLVFIYLFKKITLWEQKLRNHQSYKLKFGQIITLCMILRRCNFGGATSRGLGQMHPNL